MDSREIHDVTLLDGLVLLDEGLEMVVPTRQIEVCFLVVWRELLVDVSQAEENHEIADGHRLAHQVASSLEVAV